MKYTLLILLLVSNLVFAGAREINDYHWEGVERVVAIGDIHGDYDNYLKVLKLAGLIDKKGKWSGGKTHFVQTGDIPDRGPDTGKIISHLLKLEKQAKKKGGRVHALIGNHEAMNMYGDLRYVHAGEFGAFANRNSAALRDRYYQMVMQDLESRDPEKFAGLPETYREEWNTNHPLGWVEHQQAWNPAWNPEGKFANWVLDHKAVIKINDTIFLHGGISSFYCQNSLQSITEKIHAGLKQYDPVNPGIVEDQHGPLWYRGLSGLEPQALPETVDAILQHQGVQRIVVGHTPTSGVIWPQYDTKVVMIDSGISSAYGGHLAYLEITASGLNAGYQGGKLPLPPSDDGRISYLEKVIGIDPDNPYLQERLELLLHPVPPAAEESPGSVDGSSEAVDAGPAKEKLAPAEPAPICGIYQ